MLIREVTGNNGSKPSSKLGGSIARSALLCSASKFLLLARWGGKVSCSLLRILERNVRSHSLLWSNTFAFCYAPYPAATSAVTAFRKSVDMFLQEDTDAPALAHI